MYLKWVALSVFLRGSKDASLTKVFISDPEYPSNSFAISSNSSWVSVFGVDFILL